MQRALRRANIPIWSTQGFNPHPYIVFALALSLFYESDCEFMDAKLDGEMPLDEVRARLTEQMPEGIVIMDVTPSQMKLADIGFASYSVTLEFYGVARGELEDMLKKMLLSDEIMIEKATKRKTFDMNIKDIFTAAGIEISDGQIKIAATLPVGAENSLNPSCFSAAFEKYCVKPDFENTRRLAIYNKDMQEFK
jgi:radical SAM-linked protein